MKRKIVNMGASVRERLLTLARKDGVNLDSYLVRYAHERLLHRLGQSRHRDSFILKGAMLQTVWLDGLTRPTRDLDFLAFGDIEAEAVFREILSIDADDGVAFDIDSISVRTIQEEKAYGGLRITINADIAGAAVRIKVDLGFGDAVYPDPTETEYPVLLDSPNPRIRAYPKEAVVAEKFQAITILGKKNTRMKDYFDLWIMSQHLEFDADPLSTSVSATFERRKTRLPDDVPVGLSEAFATDPAVAKLWVNFNTRNKLDTQPPGIRETTTVLSDFLMPMVRRVHNEEAVAMTWPPGGPWKSGVIQSASKQRS